jgi:hypothetical protein
MWQQWGGQENGQGLDSEDGHAKLLRPDFEYIKQAHSAREETTQQACGVTEKPPGRQACPACFSVTAGEHGVFGTCGYHCFKCSTLPGRIWVRCGVGDLRGLEWLCVQCCAGEGLPWRLDGVCFEPEAVVEDAEVQQDFSGVDEECSDGVRFQFGSGVGPPA